MTLENQPMVGEVECPLAELGTGLNRVRCERPVLVDRMLHSLSTHGQLTAVAVVRRSCRLEILDGFKRLKAAKRLNWPTLRVIEMELDDTAQWAVMLLLNKGPQSMSILEEALVLKELAATGLTQVQIGQLVHRHKSWVCRRIGLVEHLAHELLEDMKQGLLSAGMARRLLSLPPGNQLEFAAVARQQQMTVHETEKLVSLWHRSEDPLARAYILKEPKQALANVGSKAKPLKAPADPRLSPEGRETMRLTTQLQQIADRLKQLLQTTPVARDLRLLRTDLLAAVKAIGRLANHLGSPVSGDRTDESDASVAIS